MYQQNCRLQIWLKVFRNNLCSCYIVAGVNLVYPVASRSLNFPGRKIRATMSHRESTRHLLSAVIPGDRFFFLANSATMSYLVVNGVILASGFDEYSVENGDLRK